MEISEVYLGADVSKFLLELNISKEEIQFFRLRCLNFYVEACSQIIRFPLNKNNNLKLFDFADPNVVKEGKINSIAEVVINFPHLVANDDLQAIDFEWCSLLNVIDILFQKK